MFCVLRTFVPRQRDQSRAIVDQIEATNSIWFGIEEVPNVVRNALTAKHRKRRLTRARHRDSLLGSKRPRRNFRNIDANDLMTLRQQPRKVRTFSAKRNQCATWNFRDLWKKLFEKRVH